MPSNTHALSMGMYCFVMILMASCATMPPVRADMLCSSPPRARATSSQACMTRISSAASGTKPPTVVLIWSAVAVASWLVADKAR